MRESTVGKVIALVPDAAESRVFGQIELPALLSNPRVTDIGGIPADALKEILARKDMTTVFELVRDTSFIHIVYSDFSISEIDGKSSLQGINEFQESIDDLQGYP